ncbi:hypothetical protein [Vreelandella nigrificans]|uniref:Uncharacterized protein n=1 Tax=Vreelandella nigrificans TaxID=2042704 RepID=A0A2A4HGY0_9GAMM|nr:hypothetical protein [Halomonas nigrificans]PCF94628.1 hypothetical protein CPA45_16425 [Halomonas nigrificans]
MNDILQVIGSFASILGVPLAVYLYLKSQVQKYAQVRREIVKRLSHQIGEGRTVGLFELNAVIDSLVRENRLRKESITGNSIIEDLIAETVSSPLLDSGRKEQLISELSQVHSIGKIFYTIQSDDSTFEKFIAYLKAENGDTEEVERVHNKILSASRRTRESTKTPEMFAVISATISLTLAFLASTASLTDLTSNFRNMSEFLGNDIFINVSLGVGASLLGVVVVALIAKLSAKK